MTTKADASEARHLVPNDEPGRTKRGLVYREAVGGEEANYDVETTLYTLRVEGEFDDPMTALLVFRELRRITNNADIEDVHASFSVEFSGLEKRDLEALERFRDLAWMDIRAETPSVERVYYRKRADADS